MYRKENILWPEGKPPSEAYCDEERRLAFQMQQHRELAARPPPALAPAAAPSETWRMGARTRSLV